MTEIKIIALDLDGTLFNSDKKVSEKNQAALKKARQKGAKIVITTGRPLMAIGNLLSELDLATSDDYSITFNGGLVQSNDGKILYKNELQREQLWDIYQTLEPLGLPFDVLSEGIVYSIPCQGNKSLYHTANPLLTFVELDNFDDIPKDVIYNKVVTVIDADFLDRQISQLPKAFYDNYEVFKSRDILLEIMPKDVHKAAGLTLLCQHLGLSAQNVMAMGDEENDISMLSWAGLGVAMANGSQIAKDHAKAVTTKTNDQDGVAEAIEQYVLDEV